MYTGGLSKPLTILDSLSNKDNISLREIVSTDEYMCECIVCLLGKNLVIHVHVLMLCRRKLEWIPIKNGFLKLLKNWAKALYRVLGQISSKMKGQNSPFLFLFLYA